MTTTLLTALYQTQGEGNFENDYSTSTVVFNQTAANVPSPAFTAAVDVSVTKPTAPLTVQFTDTSTTPASTTISAWLWSFGDGATATTQSPTHVYANEGIYDVTLTVTNANGSATVIQSGCVHVFAVRLTPATQTVLGAAKSVAQFTASVTTGAHPLTVTFTDTSTNTPLAWHWDFGDSGKSSLQSPVYVFGHAGTFGVTVTVENAGGLTTSVPMTITVS